MQEAVGMTQGRNRTKPAYSKQELIDIARCLADRDRAAPLEGVMQARGRRGGMVNGVKNKLIGNSRWSHSMRAKFIRKFRFDPSLRQRTIKGNKHPETTFPQRPDYEQTLDLGGR